MKINGDYMDIKYYSITALNRAIKNMFDSKPELSKVYIKGEISNFKHHTRGHLYFTLKDENSRIAAVMFDSYASKLNFEPEDGVKVLVTGRVTVYEATGGYQIYVEKMEVDGIGNLYLEYEKLKKKLAEEGLFNPEHKKPIPRFPKRIGIITAPTGAAIRDILSTIKRRYPICETILFPALVQGVGAKESIVKQLGIAQDYDLDVIICGRGGGSIEDLWAFNEEIVARAIYASKIPVISAVGHEIDFTIADFVADLRAPTPTGAAEMAVPNLVDLKTLINQYEIRLNENIKGIISFNKKRVLSIKDSYVLRNPLALYEVKEQKLDTFIEQLPNIYVVFKNNYTFNIPLKLLFDDFDDNYKVSIFRTKLKYNSLNKDNKEEDEEIIIGYSIIRYFNYSKFSYEDRYVNFYSDTFISECPPKFLNKLTNILLYLLMFLLFFAIPFLIYIKFKMKYMKFEYQY